MYAILKGQIFHKNLHLFQKGFSTAPTFDMSGMARLAGACPLDGMVRPLCSGALHGVFDQKTDTGDTTKTQRLIVDALSLDCEAP